MVLEILFWFAVMVQTPPVEKQGSNSWIPLVAGLSGLKVLMPSDPTEKRWR